MIQFDFFGQCVIIGVGDRVCYIEIYNSFYSVGRMEMSFCNVVSSFVENIFVFIFLCIYMQLDINIYIYIIYIYVYIQKLFGGDIQGFLRC